MNVLKKIGPDMTKGVTSISDGPVARYAPPSSPSLPAIKFDFERAEADFKKEVAANEHIKRDAAQRAKQMNESDDFKKLTLSRFQKPQFTMPSFNFGDSEIIPILFTAVTALYLYKSYTQGGVDIDGSGTKRNIFRWVDVFLGIGACLFLISSIRR